MNKVKIYLDINHFIV